jgi:uncharacterized protein (DUF736 family)
MAGLKRVGALWFKQSKSGNKYISISLNLEKGKVINLVAFTNSKKKTKNYPDYEIFIREEKKQETKKEQ